MESILYSNVNVVAVEIVPKICQLFESVQISLRVIKTQRFSVGIKFGAS